MKIGRYEVIEQLGKGGMAFVYLAHDPYINRQVAVKVLPRQFTHDPEFRIRFQREAQVIAALEHAYIVPVYDFGDHDDEPFIVMRYLPGGTLTDKLKTGALTLSEIIPLFQNIATALDYAHKNKVIHRDIKPGNILFDSEGKAHLSDFGIAKLQEASSAFTGTGNLIGTPAYMSPEQAKGEKSVDGRADIYSLGVVLFQCLSGELPYKADTPMSVAIAHIQKPIPSLLALRPDLPPAFEGILRKALDKDPAMRYQTVTEFADAIRNQATPSAVTTEMHRTPVESPPTLITRSEPKGQPVPAQSALQTAPPSPAPHIPTPSAPKNSGFLRLVGAGAVILLAFLCLGVIGGFAFGLIPNPFATEAANTSTEEAGIGSQGNLPSPTQESATSTPEPVEESTPTPDALSSEITDDSGTVMLLVSAGVFPMGGSDIDAETDERTVHAVHLDDYYIDKFEVTNKAYQACVTEGSCKPPMQTDSFTRSTYYGVSEYDQYPVVYVDWNMANAYCEWRGARLPTEAEWEKAARGPDDQRYYPWGTRTISCQFANYNGPGGCYNGTTQVGSYEDGKSPFGVYDMAGNVWEWVADWYSETYYQVSPPTNPAGPDSGQARVLRGGSWNRQQYDLRVSNRNRYNPSYYNFDIGFRCAGDVP